MVKILEAVTLLAPGAFLKVVHNRVPYPLFPRLEERGLHVECHEHPDGSVELTILRPATS
ncbi:MAG: DUF2249 protein [Magnetococcales bacterium]|nr:DUF2249 protein [Magnetococcales bacterium]